MQQPFELERNFTCTVAIGQEKHWLLIGCKFALECLFLAGKSQYPLSCYILVGTLYFWGLQPCHYVLYTLNVLYDSVRYTISLKVRKMYYKMLNSDLYYRSTIKSYIYAIKVPNTP